MNRAQKILELFGDIGGANLRLQKDQKYLQCQSCGYIASFPSGVYGTDGLGDTTRAPLMGENGDVIQYMADKAKAEKTGKFVDRGHMDYNPKTNKVEKGFSKTKNGKKKLSKFFGKNYNPKTGSISVGEKKKEHKCKKCGGMMEVHVSSARVMGGQSGPRAQTAPGGAISGGAYH